MSLYVYDVAGGQALERVRFGHGPGQTRDMSCYDSATEPSLRHAPTERERGAAYVGFVDESNVEVTRAHGIVDPLVGRTTTVTVLSCAPPPGAS
jgi:hypothetical protein